MSTLADKIAAISGGTTGIGLAIAQRFVAEGAHVFIFGRRRAQLDEAASLIGRNVTAIQADAANLDDLDRGRKGRNRCRRHHRVERRLYGTGFDRSAPAPTQATFRSRQLLEESSMSYAIIGLGKIGTAIAQAIARQAIEVAVFAACPVRQA